MTLLSPSCQLAFRPTWRLPVAAAVVLEKVVDDGGAHRGKRDPLTDVPASHGSASADQLEEAVYQSEIK